MLRALTEAVSAAGWGFVLRGRLQAVRVTGMVRVKLIPRYRDGSAAVALAVHTYIRTLTRAPTRTAPFSAPSNEALQLDARDLAAHLVSLAAEATTVALHPTPRHLVRPQGAAAAAWRWAPRPCAAVHGLWHGPAGQAAPQSRPKATWRTRCGRC